MAKTLSPLVVNTRAQKPLKTILGERGKENIRFGLGNRPQVRVTTPTPKSRASAGKEGGGDTSSQMIGFDLMKSGPTISMTQSRKTLPKIRTPLATLPEDVTDDSEASNPVPLPTIHRKIALWSRKGVETASARNDRIKAHTTLIEKRVHQLEVLARGFNEKVEGVARGFKELVEELSEYSEEFEALEVDHLHALEAVEEERSSACHYIENLRNAEVRISALHECLEAGSGEALCGYSQAKSYEPTYNRYA
ncbi:hypothetical protein FA13DRAFT_1798199 [Coprinellus micaceus]|uniref:Uncharacterized protein n=1 Tax=Coprinellus micaceus TaxID=71717 RepID=A0A4Y7SNJ4_COPMI|nr:hypothetical protein FA13DRAFT_1798199 [Coprinellus micaceus]